MSDIQMILDQLGLEKNSQERRDIERALRKRLREKIIELRGRTIDPEAEARMHTRAKLAAGVNKSGTEIPNSIDRSLVRKSSAGSLSTTKIGDRAVLGKFQPVRLAAKGIAPTQEREKPIPAVIIVNNRSIAEGQLDLERGGRVFLIVEGDGIPQGLLVDGSKAQLEGREYSMKVEPSDVAISSSGTFRIPKVLWVTDLKWKRAKAASKAASSRGEKHVSIYVAIDK
jgi:hypothetical protein